MRGKNHEKLNHTINLANSLVNYSQLKMLMQRLQWIPWPINSTHDNLSVQKSTAISCYPCLVTHIGTINMFKGNVHTAHLFNVENNVLFSEWHKHTRKKEIRVLLSGVGPKTFRLLVRMLCYWATEDSWGLGHYTGFMGQTFRILLGLECQCVAYTQWNKCDLVYFKLVYWVYFKCDHSDG